MKFPEAFEALKEGRPVRRAASRFQSLRLVDPRREPDIDGSARVFVILGSDGRYMSNLGEYESEEDAKGKLKALRTALTKEYSTYRKLQEAYDAATPDKREEEKLQPGISPVFRENYYEGALVQERTASRTNRINTSYLLGTTREGTVEPVCLTGADLLAPDWSVC